MKKFLLSLIALLVLGLLFSVAMADGTDGDSTMAGDPYEDPTRVTTLPLLDTNWLDVMNKDPNVEVLTYSPETCTTNGFLRFKCKYGEVTPEGFHIHEWVLPMHHVWSDEKYFWSEELSNQNPNKWGRVIKEPTCTEPGIAQGYCVVCGITHYINDVEVLREIAPLGHLFNGKYKVVEAPNCIYPGKAVEVCSRCGVESGKIWKYKPTDDANEAQLDEEYKYVHDQPKNREDWRELKPDHRLSRKDYVEVFGGKLADPYGHDWDGWVVEQAATCCKEGVRIRWCKICGDKQLGVIPKLNAKYEVSKRRLMNCYWEEWTYSCIYCHGACHPDKYEYRQVVAHEFDISTDKWLAAMKLPTCTEDGFKAYYCIHCLDALIDPDSVLDPDGNTIYHVNYPTKGELDLEADDLYIVILPKLGHEYTDWELRHAPGAGGNEYGYWLRTCKRCFKTEEYISETAPTNDMSIDGEPVHIDRNGLFKDKDGAWKLFKNDKVDEKFTGVLAYDGVEFFVTKGVVDTDAQGLNLFDGTWYFLADGQVKRGYDGFAEYNNNWFIIKNGELDPNANGLFAYDGGTFLFAAGRLRTDVDGLWQDAKGDWYYLSKGQVQTQYSGVVEYDGAFFVVKNGKLDKTAEGTIEYDGQTFNVVAGQLYAIEEPAEDTAADSTEAAA